ncbi:MAG: hypothetical protein IMZ60_02560 [Actinobacteria bacterium]|nr:hypothetical protein [Actinomycetota bacterium]
MKIFKMVLAIWMALLGVLITLMLFRSANKTKVYRKIKKLIEEDEDFRNSYR